MNILITGGAGYLGYGLTHALDKVETIESITIYDNLYRKNLNFFTQGNKLKKVKFIKGDILNEHALSQACKNQDVVIHLAGHVDFPYSYKDNYRYEQVNQFGTATLYNVLREAPPKKVIYASSGAVYGLQENADENKTPIPDNAYGMSKYEGEKYINLLQKDSQVHILRIGNVFGYNPMFRYDAVINHFIFDALLYNKIQILGSGNQQRPFVHISHVIDRLVETIINPKAAALLNVVQESMSMNQILNILLNLQPKLEYTYVNAHHNYKSYTMSSTIYHAPQEMEQCIEDTYAMFKEVYKLTV